MRKRFPETSDVETFVRHQSVHDLPVVDSMIAQDIELLRLLRTVECVVEQVRPSQINPILRRQDEGQVMRVPEPAEHSRQSRTCTLDHLHVNNVDLFRTFPEDVSFGSLRVVSRTSNTELFERTLGDNIYGGCD